MFWIVRMHKHVFGCAYTGFFRYFQGIDRDTGDHWEVDNAFKVQVSLALTMKIFAPLETIFSEDDVPDDMLVIQRGEYQQMGLGFRV